MVVGDSQWLGAASTAGHYVDLTDFFNKHKLGEMMAPATVKYYAEYPGNSGKYWAIPAEGDAVGWSYRKDWFEDPKEMEAFKAKYGYDLAVPEGLEAAARHRRVLPPSRREAATASRSTPTTPMTRWSMGFENALFSYGGELGDYATYKVDGIINSDKAVAALEAYRSSTASRRRAGPRPSSSRTTRRSPKAWRR